MKRSLTLFLAGAMLAAGPVAAIAQPAPAAADATVSTLARKLAELAMPGDLLIVQNRSSIPLLLDAEAKQSPELQAMFAEHPDLRAKLIETGQREITRVMTLHIPTFQARMAEFYARNLDEKTLRAVVAFYETDLGRKLVRAEYQSINTDALFAQDDIGDRSMARSDVDKLYSGMEGRMISALTPQERVRAATFTASPEGRNLYRLTSQTKDQTVKLINELVVPHRAEMEAAYTDTIADFFTNLGAGQ